MDYRATEEKPLSGKTVLITRSREQASELVRRVEEYGGVPYMFPVIEIVPPADPASADHAIKQIASFDWIVFTSVNGVEFFLARALHHGVGTDSFQGLRVAAVGETTYRRLQERGIHVDCVPVDFRSESLAQALRGRLQRGDQVLLPRADIATSVLPDALSRMGCDVYEAVVYETRPASTGGDEVVSLLDRGIVDVITFTSSSTVRNFVRALGSKWTPELMKHVKAAAIGPVTAKTAAEYGINITVTAKTSTLDGLLEAIVQCG